MSEGLKNWFLSVFKQKTSFMALVGWVLIVTMITMDFYQLLQLNYFFGRGKLDVDIYDRMTSNIIVSVKEHSMIALLYYFGNKLTDNGTSQ